MMLKALATAEWLKTRRRAAFWLSLLVFFGMLLISPMIEWFVFSESPERYRGNPVWPGIADSTQSIGLLMMLVMITLLTASEKTWRTERQNVIDGLSRSQYFLGKLMLVVAVALIIWTGSILIGAIFEALFRQFGTPAEPAFISTLFIRQFVSLLVFLLFCGTIALFFGAAASSSGAALALAFLFLLIQPAIASEMADSAGVWAELTAYLPMQVMSALGSPATHDAERMAAFLESARAQGRPLMLPAVTAIVVALGSSALFAAAAWWSIRSRDL